MRRSLFSIVLTMVAALAAGVAQAGDQEIANSVLQQLKSHQDTGALKGFNIKLSVKEGRVWMKGSVANQEQHQLAIESARRVEGVTMVVNELTIDGETHEHPEQQKTLPQRARDFFAGNQSQEQATEQPQLPTPVALQQPERIAERIGEPVHTDAGFDASTLASQQTVEVASREQAVPALDQQLPTPTVAPELPTQAVAPTLPQRRTVEEAVQATPASDAVPAVQAIQQPQVQAQPQAQAQQQMQALVAMPIITPQMQQHMQQAYMAQMQQQMMAQQAQMLRQRQASGRPAAIAPSTLPGSNRVARRPARSNPRYGGLMAPIAMANMQQPVDQAQAAPQPQFIQGTGGGVIPARYDHPQMPGYSWPSYASHPNYAALQYPKQHAAHAWPYIGPFYPYPQVPLGWRKVTLSWDDGWWFLDFKDKGYGPYITR